MKYLLLLILAGVCFGANDYSGDPNVVLEMYYEDGALNTDSSGTHATADVDIVGDTVADTVLKYAGTASADFPGVSDSIEITDSNCTGLLASDEATPEFSVCFWANSGSISAYDIMVSKYKTSGDLRSMFIACDNSGQVNVAFGNSSGTGRQLIDADLNSLQMHQDRWEMVCLAFDDSDKSYIARLYDDDGDVNSVSDTYTANISLTTAPFAMGSDADYANEFNGNIDNLVAFDRKLTTDEMDEIHAGTYSYGTATPSTTYIQPSKSGGKEIKNGGKL